MFSENENRKCFHKVNETLRNSEALICWHQADCMKRRDLSNSDEGTPIK